jgi:hypothetical protein
VCDRVVLFCRVRDWDENRAAHQSEIYCEIGKRENFDRNREIVDALEDTHFTENGKSRNEQVTSKDNDDRFLRHQKRNRD